jgi:Concanavalin A-like lectin/glucanases superfamily
VFPWLVAAMTTTACDFDQLHSPAAAGAASSATTRAAGTTTGGAGGTASGDTTATVTTTTTTTSGGAGTGGAAGAVSDASSGGSGGLADASSDGAPCAGFALQFNGTSSYATLNRPVQNDFTLEAWIKPSATLPVLTGTQIYQGYGIIYADVNTTTNDFGTSLVNGKFAFGVGNPDTNVQSASLITNGQWSHVAATRSMTTGVIQVIVNGVVDGTLTTTQTGVLSAPPTIALGADTIDRHFFNGLMDEVRLWSVVRTPADIVATMHQRLTGAEVGLVGYYRFDEGSGATATDSSPTHGNAMLVGTDGGATGAWVASDAPVSCP